MGLAVLSLYVDLPGDKHMCMKYMEVRIFRLALTGKQCTYSPPLTGKVHFLRRLALVGLPPNQIYFMSTRKSKYQSRFGPRKLHRFCPVWLSWQYYGINPWIELKTPELHDNFTWRISLAVISQYLQLILVNEQGASDGYSLRGRSHMPTRLIK